MTRFTICMNEAIDLVMWTMNNSIGGEIIVPKIPSYKITDLIKIFSKKPKIKIIGIRQGEKIHEEMISSEESRNCIEVDNKYIIAPSEIEAYIKKVKKNFKVKKFDKKNFKSNENKFLKPEEISKIIKKELNNFIF